jgi:hypothetical protein
MKLVLQIEALEQQKDALRAKIQEEMIANNKKKEEFSFGSFSLTGRKTWEYPQYVKDAEETFKTLQEQAKSNEEATYTETFSLRFTPAKL